MYGGNCESRFLRDEEKFFAIFRITNADGCVIEMLRVFNPIV